MSTIILLFVTGIGLGALYFLMASGLSLIYGLMGVLNLAHGAFLTFAAYAAYEVAARLDATSWPTFLLTVAIGAAIGGVLAAITEFVFIRPLYNRHIEQVLVTVGLGLASVAIAQGVWTARDRHIESPRWMRQTTSILGARIPNDRFLAILAAVVVLGALVLFLNRTRYGLIVRAGVENRTMVTALGIDVRKAFTLVFSIGGVAAGIGGVLTSHYFQNVNPHLGSSVLIYAFIVTVIGGPGSLYGSAIAAVVVALAQQYANYYTGYGDLIVVLLLAGVLLVRPGGLLGGRT